MGIDSVREVVRPTTVVEAWEAMAAEPNASRFLAGGIELALYTPPSVTRLIDLSRVPIRGVWNDGGDLVLGATTSLTEAMESPLVAEYAGGLLVSALRRVASPLQRNVATVGGAIVRGHPWSDVLCALVALDAEAEVFDGERVRVDVRRLRDRGAESQSLVVAVRLPGALNDAFGGFEKFARTAFDIAALNCACAARVVDGVCRTARVVVGGVPAAAARVPEAENVIEGRSLTQDAIARAAQVAAARIDARDDRRATAWYRRQLAAVGVRRCLVAIAEGRSGGR